MYLKKTTKHSKHQRWIKVLFLMVIVEIIIHHFGNKKLPEENCWQKISLLFFFLCGECFTFVTEQSGLSVLFVCLLQGAMASSTAWSFHHFKKEQQPLLYLTSRTWFKHVFKITYEHEADLITRSRFGFGLIQCPRGLFQYGRMGTNADRSAVLSVRQGMSLLLLHTPSSSFPPSFVIIFLSLAPFFCHAPSLWEMAPVFQLACNGPLTRMASGELGPQQMLPWIGRSSAACRLYWIVIRVELSIHDICEGGDATTPG